jgi:hypothetical protein
MSSRGLQLESVALPWRAIACSSRAVSAWAPVHSCRWPATCHILFHSRHSTTHTKSDRQVLERGRDIRGCRWQLKCR